MAIDYREEPGFSPDYTSNYFEHKPRAPFPVSITGVLEEGPFLGVGTVIGCREDGMPVIEVQDGDGDNYQVLGVECFWTTPVPEEMIEAIESGELAVSSVRTYLQQLAAEEVIDEAEETVWLEDNGIDPEL